MKSQWHLSSSYVHNSIYTSIELYELCTECHTTKMIQNHIFFDFQKQDHGSDMSSSLDVIIVAQLTQRTPAEFCVRGTQNSNKIRNALRRIPAFSREILLDFEHHNRAISAPNAALTQPKTAPTSCVLRNARGACWLSFVSVAHRHRKKFASESRVFSRKFPRFRIRKSTNLGAKRSADSAEFYADIMRVAQRT